MFIPEVGLVGYCHGARVVSTHSTQWKIGHFLFCISSEILQMFSLPSSWWHAINVLPKFVQATYIYDPEGQHCRSLIKPMFWTQAKSYINATLQISQQRLFKHNYIHHIHQHIGVHVITQPCHIFSGGLAKPPLKLGHGWVIIPHIKLRT